MINKVKFFIKLIKFKQQWRKKNRHNQTQAKRIFQTEKVSVGKYSYGDLNVYSWGSENEGLEIGNYVSIANDVKFILGGNHRYDTISTYPFKVKFMGEKIEAYSNGKITVCDDVWIGMNSMIMSGITIGRGAVIAAGSVVVKDVPEFSVVGGNPAKIIKYRFNDEIRLKLKQLDLLEIKEEFIISNIDQIYDTVSTEMIEKIIIDCQRNN